MIERLRRCTTCMAMQATAASFVLESHYSSISMQSLHAFSPAAHWHFYFTRAAI